MLLSSFLHTNWSHFIILYLSFPSLASLLSWKFISLSSLPFFFISLPPVPSLLFHCILNTLPSHIVFLSSFSPSCFLVEFISSYSSHIPPTFVFTFSHSSVPLLFLGKFLPSHSSHTLLKFRLYTLSSNCLPPDLPRLISPLFHLPPISHI